MEEERRASSSAHVCGEMKRRKAKQVKDAPKHLGSVGSGTFSFSLCDRIGSVCVSAAAKRTADKDGGNGEDAAGSAGNRRQMRRGDSTQVEAARRRRQGLRRREQDAHCSADRPGAQRKRK